MRTDFPLVVRNGCLRSGCLLWNDFEARVELWAQFSCGKRGTIALEDVVSLTRAVVSVGAGIIAEKAQVAPTRIGWIVLNSSERDRISDSWYLVQA